ncbi:MAG: hypothetical protein JW709_09350 [Sedimentisphaerales bacterium]|nr:hypothetical protein [Sedimentisphaerales bacterium]
MPRENLPQNSKRFPIILIGILIIFISPLIFFIFDIQYGFFLVLFLTGVVFVLIGFISRSIIKEILPKNLKETPLENSLVENIWKDLIQESSDLPSRNDKPYQRRKVVKCVKYSLYWLILSPVVFVAGFAFYMPGLEIFGKGLQILALCPALTFFVGIMIAVAFMIIPNYKCGPKDTFLVLEKPLKALKQGPEKAISTVRALDELSLNLVLPEHRYRLEQYVNAIHKELKKKTQDLSFGISSFIWDNTVYCEKRIACGSVKLINTINKSKFVELKLLSVQSGSRNWYFAVPDLNNPEKWMRFKI